MKSVISIFQTVEKIVARILSVLLAAIVIIICLQTFFRYVIAHTLPWSEELTRYLFIFIVSCGFCIGISKNALIRINLIDGFLGVKGMRFFQILYDASGVFVCGVLCKYNLSLIKTGMTRLTSALAPMRFGHIYIVMEVGFALALVAAVLKLMQSILIFASETEVNE